MATRLGRIMMTIWYMLQAKQIDKNKHQSIKLLMEFTLCIGKKKSDFFLLQSRSVHISAETIEAPALVYYII